MKLFKEHEFEGSTPTGGPKDKGIFPAGTHREPVPRPKYSVDFETFMGIKTVGKVVVEAKVENLADLFMVERGHLTEDRVRRIEVRDALVDTGATILSMPKKLIAQLGLSPVRSRQARTAAGPITVQIYGTTRLTIQGRECVTDVSELPDDCPVLVGQVPLELLDFVVDPPGERLIGNPAHGGEHQIDLY